MTLHAILDACADAGVSPREIDGFVSYAGGSNDGPILGDALGIDELRWSNMMWGGGGGSVAAAITNAATAIAGGQADVVAVYRAMSQADTGRPATPNTTTGRTSWRTASARPRRSAPCAPSGCSNTTACPVTRCGHWCWRPTSTRSKIRPRKPTASRSTRTPESSRLIAEPFHLFDCSRESDGAVALILVSAERARDLRPDPVYVLAGAQGSPGGYCGGIDNDVQYSTAGFGPANNGKPGVAERLWRSAGLGPNDVDVVQVYENFSGPAVAALIDHGLCPPGEAAGGVLTVENLTAPFGKLPVNTSGGNLADAFVNGLNLAVEAVRQIRGTSTNQVAGARTSLFIGGPMAPLVSSVLFSHPDVLR